MAAALHVYRHSFQEGGAKRKVTLMKLNKNIAASGLLLGAIGMTFLGAGAGVANAGSSVRKDIAIGGAATAVYGLLDHNRTAAVVGGVVAAGALAGGHGHHRRHHRRYRHTR